jgi:hypothetical protein
LHYFVLVILHSFTGPTPNIELVISELLQLKIPVSLAESIGAESEHSPAKGTSVDTRSQSGANGFAKLGGRSANSTTSRGMKSDGQKRKDFDS